MEYKIQDILKNIIPGFYIIAWMLTFLFLLGLFDFKIIDRVKVLPSELLVFFVPLILYIVGYLNDIFASFIEYYFYEWGLVARPSHLLLSNKKKRYILNELDRIKTELKIDGIINCEKSKAAFKKANMLKDKSDMNEIIQEFYVSYIFSRNIMSASLFVLILSLLSFIVANMWYIIFFIFLLFLIFFYRWKQKAIYYSKKVLESVVLK